jgi:hypothetical protein
MTRADLGGEDLVVDKLLAVFGRGSLTVGA